MKGLDEITGLLRDFERHEEKFRYLVEEINETILPAVPNLRTFNDYALGKVNVLIHALQVTSERFRLDRLPKLKGDSDCLEFKYVTLMRGEMAMLENMAEMLDRKVEHLKEFV